MNLPSIASPLQPKQQRVRERERERERQRQRETEIETDTERQRRDTEAETHRETHSTETAVVRKHAVDFEDQKKCKITTCTGIAPSLS